MYGFSPNQLDFGKKPNFPNVESNKLPALEGVTCSKIDDERLSALPDVRQAFTKSKFEEKLRRALRHQVRTREKLKVQPLIMPREELNWLVI